MIYTVEPSCQIQDLPTIYQVMFGDKFDGTFVEVGAYDGRTWSNTYNLACMGWKGIYIEVDEGLCEQCKANHADHDVTVVNACVGDGNPITLYNAVVAEIDPNSYITTAASMYLNHAVSKTLYKTIQTVTLNEILEKQGIQQIDVLCIDVEGMEPSVLRGFDLEYMPAVVIVESCEMHPVLWLRENVPFLDNYFQIGYVKVYADTVNTIYCNQSILVKQV